jgi:BolA protein
MVIDLRKTRAVAPKRKKGEKEEPARHLIQEDPVASEIVKRIRETFSPTKMSLQNVSHKHKGHKGKKGSGAHFELSVVSELFMGLPALQRQKIVLDLLKDLMGKKIHALKLDLKDPTQIKLQENP